jgi:hypothetical protein
MKKNKSKLTSQILSKYVKKYDVGGNFQMMNKDGTYGVQEQPQDNTNWANMVSMAGNMVQGTQNYSKSPNASMYKTEDAVWDTVGQMGGVGAVVGGITDIANTALRPVRESNDKKAGTSGYSNATTIGGGLLNPFAALQTRGTYEGGYGDITGELYEKHLASLNKQKKFKENIGQFDANLGQHNTQVDYLRGKQFDMGGSMNFTSGSTLSKQGNINNQTITNFSNVDNAKQTSPFTNFNGLDPWITFEYGGDLNIKDPRTVNQYNEPLDPTKRKNPNNVNKQVVEDLVKGSYDRNLNPFTTLAIGLQETNLGTAKGVYGESLNKNPLHYNGAKNFTGENSLNESLDFLKDKNNYAKNLGKTKEADKIQAWNGYGKMREAYDLTLYTPENEQKFYGKSLKNNPIDFNKTPVYGETVVNLRDSVIQQNPELVQIANKHAPSENKRIVGGQSQPMEYSKGGKMCYTDGGNMTTTYSNGGTHESNPLGGIPIGQDSLVEEGEVRFNYKDKDGKKSYIFSNQLFVDKKSKKK